MACRFCACNEETIIPGPHPGGHAARANCAACGRLVRWVAKEDSERIKRPAAHRDLAKKYGKGLCSMCGKTQEKLPANQAFEAHHIVAFEKGGTNDRDNIVVICTACHKLIHWLRHHWD